MMEKIDKGHALSQSTDFVAQNIETLKKLFPTIVKEGKIDIKELKALLGDDVETEEEYYRFTWAGKSMARREANKPSTATLRPDKESSKDWDTTQNIFIEGDNLEVLKLLQKSYANKIKMIYIDPPYNTGKDFVYKDNYNDNLGNYLAITGQVDEEGKRINTNSESDGRYHSNWLNMMYPRLKLARNLLTEDGVVFVSIDDNEATNLNKVLIEIFGEENFVCQFTREAIKGGSQSRFVRETHDFILVYAKELNCLEFKGFEKEELELNLIDTKGPYAKGRELNKWGAGSRREDSPGMWYPIKSPDGDEVFPIRNDGSEGRWRLGKEKLFKLVKEDEVIFEKRSNGTFVVYEKLRGNKSNYKQFISILKDNYLNANATEEIKSLFNVERSLFDFPKPVNLIKDLILLSSVESGDIVLDFFAGSGTTAHSTMQLNAEDGGNRKFICVQLPEPTDEKSEAYKAGYKTISEITKERIRRAGEKIKSEMKEDLFSEQGKTLDIGFRAFKLDSSNIRAWDGNPDALEDNLFNAGSNIKENRTEEDVLYEILIKYGLDLTMPIEQKAIAGKQVFNIGMGALFICLGDNITTAVAEGIGKWKEELQPATSKVIFKDTGFTDVEKTNSMQILKRYGILEVNTI